MRTSLRQVAKRTIAVFLLLVSPHTSFATTYMSVEPIPNRDVVGQSNLNAILGIGYAKLERWIPRQPIHLPELRRNYFESGTRFAIRSPSTNTTTKCVTRPCASLTNRSRLPAAQ